jgi:hypothetical protein
MHRYFYRRLMHKVTDRDYGVTDWEIAGLAYEALKKDPLQAFKRCKVRVDARDERDLAGLHVVLAGKRAPMLLELNLRCGKTDLDARSVLHAFLTFWDSHWPDLTGGQSLVVCLNLTYRNHGHPVRSPWWNIQGRRSYRRREIRHRKWREGLGELSGALRDDAALERYQRVSLAIIRELDPIAIDDALDLANRFFESSGPENPRVSREDILALYKGREHVSLYDIDTFFSDRIYERKRERR